ncbi:TrmH family RNA methyltransferase [Eisenibacter elegans]|jgi:TrmH family RNA methyltransferase|uniref:TrmH family RNA methyltransferase n=1 Tax=Eisenibacter elegans TaxID=997 RepID=UPI00041D2FA7|nr:RNA methyltransferase [Eisenibacter elegans]
MITKAQQKYIKALQIKKYRKLHQAFLVEGEKSLVELLTDTRWPVETLYCTELFYEKYATLIQQRAASYILTTADDLAKAGTLTNNQAGLAVVPWFVWPDLGNPTQGRWLILDDIQDPGNLGTILRIADWYGLQGIVCSIGTVDVYNPKVVMASMGALLRMPVYYTDLQEFIAQQSLPIYAAMLEGKNVHQFNFSPQGGLLLMGNEGHGVQPELLQYVQHSLHIPRYGLSESLNVAIATAVLCDNWLRDFGG